MKKKKKRLFRYLPYSFAFKSILKRSKSMRLFKLGNFQVRCMKLPAQLQRKLESLFSWQIRSVHFSLSIIGLLLFCAVFDFFEWKSNSSKENRSVSYLGFHFSKILDTELWQKLELWSSRREVTWCRKFYNVFLEKFISLNLW